MENDNDDQNLGESLPPRKRGASKALVPEVVKDTVIKQYRLDSLEAVRAELSRLYWKARKSIGKNVNVENACKLAYLLQQIGRALEGCEFERRIAEIERRTNEQT